MTEDYDAVVYDLDGTLVRLAVDWDEASADVAAVYEAAGIDTGDGDVWRLIEEANDHGIAASAESALAEHETEGARNARRLPLTDEVAELSVPVGVCSLNCEAACRVALERHDLDDHLDAVVGRDTIEQQKPAPEPLLTAIERLDAEPADALFVGDSASDETAADRAGVDFEWVRSRRDATP